MAGKVGAVKGHNLYTYCGNDPMGQMDENGESTAVCYKAYPADSGKIRDVTAEVDAVLIPTARKCFGLRITGVRRYYTFYKMGGIR